ncbi:MAG: AIR synthase related protein, partial [Alphaproteobacteria bacterium]
GDAAVVRIHGSNKGLASTVDCTPRYCLSDPEFGGAQAVAENFRNLCAVGAKPLAITNNLNFGNPEKPEIMGQIVGAVKGMGKAAIALDTPVVSGNVSLYNETDGQPILPTPVIGSVGLMANVDHMATVALKRDGDDLVLIGAQSGDLSGSVYARDILGQTGGTPALDLSTERKNGDFVSGLVAAGTLDTVHDVSDGGLLVAVAEMAMAGNKGASLSENLVDVHLFAEDQASYVVATPMGSELVAKAKAAGVTARIIGQTGGDKLTLNGNSINLTELVTAHEDWFPSTFG